MPAFTFEKISSPVRAKTPVKTNGKSALSDHVSDKMPRGMMVRMLDRLTFARLRRDKGDAHPQRKHPPPD